MILNFEKLINVLIGKHAFQIGGSADDVGDSFALKGRLVVSSRGVSDAQTLFYQGDFRSLCHFS
jgi:hypothetical protein